MSESVTPESKLDGADSRQATVPQEQVIHDEIYFVKDFIVIQVQYFVLLNLQRFSTQRTNLLIQIENCLFKIPRSHLVKQSHMFTSVFPFNAIGTTC
jgi:hypothetical protein